MCLNQYLNIGRETRDLDFLLHKLGNLGQIKQKITVDVGVGDVVRPRLLEVELMKDQGALFEEGITLSAYPPERSKMGSFCEKE